MFTRFNKYIKCNSTLCAVCTIGAMNLKVAIDTIDVIGEIGETACNTCNRSNLCNRCNNFNIFISVIGSLVVIGNYIIS